MIDWGTVSQLGAAKLSHASSHCHQMQTNARPTNHALERPSHHHSNTESIALNRWGGLGVPCPHTRTNTSIKAKKGKRRCDTKNTWLASRMSERSTRPIKLCQRKSATDAKSSVSSITHIRARSSFSQSSHAGCVPDGLKAKNGEESAEASGSESGRSGNSTIGQNVNRRHR